MRETDLINNITKVPWISMSSSILAEQRCLVTTRRQTPSRCPVGQILFAGLTKQITSISLSSKGTIRTSWSCITV